VLVHHQAICRDGQPKAEAQMPIPVKWLLTHGTGDRAPSR